VIARVFPRTLVVWLFVSCCLAADASGAKIPVCGSTDGEGNTVLGSLALNDNSSTTKSYGTATGARQLALLYDVTGCTLPSGTTIQPKQVSILPAKTGDDLPGAPAVTVTVDDPPDATALTAAVKLKLDDIDAGAHGGIARIRVPGLLHDSLTPISVSRTDAFMGPVVLGLLGALAGLAWALGLHFADRIQVTFGGRQWILLALLTIGAGVAAGYGYWDNQDVWTFGDNAWPTVVAGFAASTTGALAGVTAALYSPPDNDGQ
jgi:hypothetical protein